MTYNFAQRMLTTHKSFIREILKVTEDPQIISFAGGLPNPKTFPVQAVADAAAKVLREHGEEVLQYRTTEGYLPLRELIAARYRQTKGIHAEPEEILITCGSQQAQDLIGKVFLDKGDEVLLERPSYLGAIQVFSLYEPNFTAIPLQDDGIDLHDLADTLLCTNAKLMYMVPNFQNPSGISYSAAKRQGLADCLRDTGVVLVEDDPYGELRFLGEDLPPVKRYLPEQTVLVGSFSKIVSPGMRLGWICAPHEIMEKLIVAKQASDLHSSFLSQRIVHQYLLDNDVNAHITMIRALYKQQRDAMVAAITRHFPAEVTCTRPEGGMFLWVTLPEGLSSLNVFTHAIKENVAFVPGCPFYVDGSGDNAMRLNFSNSNEEQIEEGIKRLGGVLKRLLAAEAEFVPAQ